MVRRLALVLLLLAAAFAGSLALLRHERLQRIDIGGDERDARVSGFHSPEVRSGVTGRWTMGDALVSVPRPGVFTARVRVTLCGHPSRPDDRVRVVVGALDVHAARVTSSCQTLDVPVRHLPADEAVDVRIASATTTTGRRARSLGVFVDSIELTAGGSQIQLARASRYLGAAVLLFAGVMVVAWHSGVLAITRRIGVLMALSAIAGLVAWILVDRLDPRLASLQRGAMWALGAGLLLAASNHRWLERVWRRLPPATAAAAPLAVFVTTMTAVVAVLFREALFQGHVLSQANLLYRVFPWRAYLPDGYELGNPLMGDVPHVFYPFASQVQHALSSWTLPLWNPLIFTGHPLFASFQSAVLSPFTLLGALASLPMGTVVNAAARLLTGGLGLFLFARRIGLSPAACYFAGLTYALSPFSVVWLEHPHSAVAAWMPWLLWATERVAREAVARNVVILAATVAMVLLAGHPETAFKVLAFGAAYGLMAAAFSGRCLRVATCCGLAYAMGLLLCAIQVLPFVEYLQQSRVLALRQLLTANPYFLSTDTMIAAIVPDFWGHPVSDDYLPRPNRAGMPSNYCEQQVYAGAATWVLAFVGLASGRRDWRRAFFAASAVTAIALMYSLPPAIEHLTSVPLLRVTALTRFGLVAILSAFVLAAFGIDALTASAGAAIERARSWRLAVPASAAGTVLLATAFYCLVHYRVLLSGAGLFEKAFLATLFAASLILVATCLVVARARERIGHQAFGIAVCLLATADLLSFGDGFRAFIPASEVFPDMPGVRAVRADPGVFRVIGWGNVLPPSTTMPYRLQDPRGFDGMTPGRISELLDVAFSLEGSFHATTHVEASRIIDLLNVKYVFGRPGLELSEPQFARLPTTGPPVFRNSHAFPRAWLTDGYTVLTGNDARRALRDGTVDLRRVAVLEERLPAEAAPVVDSVNGPGQASIRHYRDSLVEIETRAAGRRLLVLTDAFYPGWVAMVDGIETPIGRANFAFRAVSVPGGIHVVRFEYRPLSFRIGAAISGVALIAVLVMARPAFMRRV